MIDLFNDKDFGVREAVCKALAAIGPASAPAIEGLMRQLQDDRGTVRLAATEALTAIGPPAACSIPAIKALSNDKYPSVRAAAAYAIETLESP